MALKTGRFEGVAEVTVDAGRCVGCGACAAVCRGAPLVMEDRKVKIDQSRYFGCIGCGGCVAVCPREAISVVGRDMSQASAIPLPSRVDCSDFKSLYNLMLTRRSVRDFERREVEQHVIDSLINAASTAPMGLPPSDVKVLVFSGFDNVQSFRNNLYQDIKGWKWMTHGIGALAMRPFMGKVLSEVMTGFLHKAITAFEDMDAQGRDYLLYGAPLALYFHASAYADPADPVVAATYAMIAAQSLGLGSTMLGIPGIVIKQSKRLRQLYGVDEGAAAGIAVIFGYPAFKYHRALKRQFAEVRYWGQGGKA